MDQSLEFDIELIRRYDRAGPRYTSYPTAVQFQPSFGEPQYLAAVEYSNGDPVPTPLSLYFHLPFCATVCFYCACNKVVTKNRNRAAPYLERLHHEIALQGKLFDRDRRVHQLHWGGGTPTFLNHQEMRELMAVTARHFDLVDDGSGEFSIEVDPREVEEGTVALLAEIGFNRISLGVQDLEPRVQRAVNRIQSEEETVGLMDAARREGFKSVSLDLIYGLPFQSVATFNRTLERIIAAAPDRLSVFNYAHLPHLFKPQRRINAEDLPSAAEKLEILQSTIELLRGAGYVFIGMDHFAKPDDELARAQRDGTLHRNFQGYSTRADCHLVGMGVSAISMSDYSYSQNARAMDEYCARIDAGHLPIVRGIDLSPEDRVRRDTIMELICHFALDAAAFERHWGIPFDEVFADEQPELDELAADGLIVKNARGIRILPRGRLLVRNICMVFDRYLRPETNPKRFSRVI